MKRMDALLLVVPAFADAAPDALVAGLDRLVGELCLEDLASVERRLDRARKERIDERITDALEAARSALESELPVSAADLGTGQRNELRGYALLGFDTYPLIVSSWRSMASTSPRAEP